MKKLFSFILIISSVLVLSGCKMNNPKTLVVGVRDDAPNFGFSIGDSSRVFGYDLDIAKELALRLGYDKVEYVVLKAEEREEAVNSGAVDLVIACYSYSDDRAEQFDLSVPYFEDDNLIVTTTSTMFKNASELNNCTIGIFDSDALYECAEYSMNMAGVNDYDIKRFPSYTELVANLVASEIDAICIDGCMLAGYYSGNMEILEADSLNSDYCVLMKKNSGYLSDVNEALASMKEDGFIDALEDKWCNTEVDNEF